MALLIFGGGTFLSLIIPAYICMEPHQRQELKDNIKRDWRRLSKALNL